MLPQVASFHRPEQLGHPWSGPGPLMYGVRVVDQVYETRPLTIHIFVAQSIGVRIPVPWYARTVETVDVTDGDLTETDRMWRQIGPVLYYRAKRVLDPANDCPGYPR